MRINLQLVSAANDEALWAERYDRRLEDVLGLQSDVSAAVAREIAVQVTPREATRLATHGTVNAEAHLEYMKGRYTYSAGSPQAIELSLRHFRRALELDPAFAPAWAGVADCHNVRAARGMAPPAEAEDAAGEAAEKALALDESLAEGHAALGALLCSRHDLRGGIRALERAIERNPGLPQPYFWLGRAYYCLERHAEAKAAMLKALSLDPLSMWIHTSVGDAFYYAREYETSVVYYRMAIELDPRFDGAHTDLARSLSTSRGPGTRRAGGSRAASRGRRSGSRIWPRARATPPRPAPCWPSSSRRARIESSPPGASPRCTRASAISTRRFAGSTRRSPRARPGSSTCASTRGSIPFAAIRATRTSCGRWASRTTDDCPPGYCPTTITSNEPGTIVGRGRG